MDESKTYTIGQLARLGGVSTKTLRHYERIGLLQPSKRSDAGYRLYSESDGRRLAEILAYREVGMLLKEITQMLGENSNNDSRAFRLTTHLQQLLKERQKLDGLICHIEEMILHEEEGVPMSAHDELNGFANNPYEDEARERWGHTDAYKESARRVKGYSTEDWEHYKAEAADINERFVALMQAEVSPCSDEARSLAKEHRQLISHWFYDCPPEMHAGFGQMWTSDPRFKESIDKAGEGLTEYMAEAFRCACC